MLDPLAQYFPVTDPTWIFFVVLAIILFAPMMLERLRIPSVVGMIFAGVVVGPYGLHVLERDSSFELFGKVGLYYIMFLASLEMNLQDVRKIRGQALLLGLLSFLFPFVIGLGANIGLLGCTAAAAVLMGSMYASHTLVSYPIVLRYGLSKRRSVSIAVGGTIVADVLTLLVLAVVGGMFKEGATGYDWIWLVLKVVAVGATMVVLMPRLGRRFFRRYDESVVQYIFVLGMVFLGAGLMEIVGIEGILGAFLVGIVLNRLIPPASPLMAHIEFVGNALFIPYFLIGVGMLINVGAFVEHPRVFLIAAVMIAVCTSGKWLAAYTTQKTFSLSAADRGLMFGLTNSRAAATLAVVLVGHGIVLPSGERLLSQDVLNGTMMLILCSCVISSMITERTAHRIALSSVGTEPAALPEQDRLLVALNNPETAAPLVHMALMLRAPGLDTQLTALNIVLDDDPASRKSGQDRLDQAARIAAGAGVRLLTHNRWSVNVVSGISHTMKEFEAGTLLIGLHRKSSLGDTFLGKLGQDLLSAVLRQVFIFRPVIPVNTVRRIHLIVPRKAEYEPGFAQWAERLARLGEQLSQHFEVYGGRQTLEALTHFWESRNYAISFDTHEYVKWHDFTPVAHRTRHDHMVVFVMARRGTLSRHAYMNHLSEQIERNFSARNLMLVYPQQPGAAAADSNTIRSGLPLFGA